MKGLREYRGALNVGQGQASLWKTVLLALRGPWEPPRGCFLNYLLAKEWRESPGIFLCLLPELKPSWTHWSCSEFHSSSVSRVCRRFSDKAQQEDSISASSCVGGS